MNKQITFFASGSNHSGEIKALSLIPGANVGVVAEYVDQTKYPLARHELDMFVETGRKVFIDSGAFAEVEFPAGVPTIIKPLGEKHWRKVFAVYADQALTHGENVFVVAPDCVAFQDKSLERLETYAEEMREIFDLGATILVPIQKGELSMAEFHRRASAILNAGVADGGIEFRPSIPMKKDATKLNELGDFVREIMPASIHLLGLAPDTDEGQAAIALVRSINPAIDVSCDACLIKRWVGKSNGRVNKATGKKGPRRITALNDLHCAKLGLDPEATGEHEVHVRKALTLFLAANRYWTDLGLAPVPTYTGIEPGHEDVLADLEPAYMPLVLALWGTKEESDGEEAGMLDELAERDAYMSQFQEVA